MKSKLIRKFVGTYHSAEHWIKINNAEKAKEKYKKLLYLYNKINDSELDAEHKELAYMQVQKTFNNIKGIKQTKGYTKHILITALVILVFSVLIAVKPSIIGLAAYEANNAPQWIQDTTRFDIKELTTIDLKNYFSDADGDELTFLTTHAKGLVVALQDSVITLKPTAKGEKFITFIASDGKDITKINVVVNVV